MLGSLNGLDYVVNISFQIEKASFSELQIIDNNFLSLIQSYTLQLVQN